MYARADEPTRYRCELSKTFTASHRHMNRSSTIAGWRQRRVEAWRNRPPRPSIHLLSLTDIYVSLRDEHGNRRWPSMLFACRDVNGCKDVSSSGSTRRRASMPGCQIFDEQGLAALRILASVMDGVSGLEEGVARLYSACHGSQRCIVPHPQFHRYIHASSGVHSRSSVEAHLWCHQRQAGPSGIREVQDRLAGLSRRGQRMENNFTRRAALRAMAVPCARSCTRPMPSRASTLASAS